MIIIFTPPNLTRFFNSGGYAKNELVDLSSTSFQDVPVGLLNWLQTQINSGESISQIVLEDAGEIKSDLMESGDSSNAEVGRQVINAGVSIVAPDGNGQRSISISSESLPPELRDGLLAVWEYINGLE
jgi:hypothetical protein